MARGNRSGDDGPVPSFPCVSDLVRLLRAAPARCGATKVVCVDGPAGSGKTTLAGELSDALAGAPVVHMDALYEGWDQPLGAELAARVDQWLLSAWARGAEGRYRPYDWGLERFEQRWVPVPAAPSVILEGCASASRGIRDRASLVMWVEAPQELRTRRGLTREGAHLAPQWRVWQEHEARHFTADQTRRAAQVLVDGTTGRILTADAPATDRLPRR